MPRVMSGEEIGRAIRRLSHEILERQKGADDVTLIGIHTRGVHLARRIAGHVEEAEGLAIPVGSLDIGPYRDDQAIRPPRTPRETKIPGPIDDRSVIVVDDVLYTGRTVRAAMDALSGYGRARSTQLAVLVDRGHRELPIRADYVGRNLPTNHAERITVRLVEEDDLDGVWIERPGE